SSSAGAADLHPESGWHATAARHSDLRRQGGAAGIAMVLEAVYEQDFRSCSYGFRPERSAHQALRTLHSATTRHGQYWVLDIDVRKYLDPVSYCPLVHEARSKSSP